MRTFYDTVSISGPYVVAQGATMDAVAPRGRAYKSLFHESGSTMGATCYSSDVGNTSSLIGISFDSSLLMATPLGIMERTLINALVRP
jgi:hypothetical protein